MSRKSGIIIFVAALLVVCAAAALYKNNDKTNQQESKKIDIKVKKVSQKHFLSQFTVPGMVESSDKREVFWDNNVKVKNVHIKEFDIVKKGQVLFDVDLGDIDYEITQEQINNSIIKLNIDKSEKSLLKDTRSLNKYQITIDENNAAIAKNELEAAKKEYDIARQLFGIGSISQKDYDNSLKAYEKAQLNYSSIKSTYEKTLEQDGIIKEADESDVYQKSVDVEILRQNLKLSDAKLEKLKDRRLSLKGYETAPCDGIIYNLGVNAGTYIGAAVPAYVIENSEDLIIRAKVNEKYYKDVRIGQSVVLSSDSLPISEKLEGEIVKIQPYFYKNKLLNVEENVFEIIIETKKTMDKDSQLCVGMSVNCTIVSKDLPDSITCTFDTILESSDDERYVYIYDKDTNTIKKRAIQLGSVSNFEAEVLEGISAEEYIVIDPQAGYSDNQKVRRVEYMENQ